MNKQISAAEAVSHIKSGMTIGVGGWGPRRKPMALVRELLRSGVKDLTVVAYGGPEVGMLWAAGKLKKVIYGFVSLDSIPQEPYFRKARQAGAIEIVEVDEGMVTWGLRAAGMRLPFLPTRIGLGTDVTTYNPEFKTIKSPYADGEVLLAMPALNLDVALIHVDRSDKLGNTQTFGPDHYFDDQFARAAEKCFVSAEEVVDRIDLTHPEDVRANMFERFLVTGVVHAPCGAHPTSFPTRYGADWGHLKAYAAGATEEDGWDKYVREFVAGGEADYIQKVGGAEKISKLPLPIY